MKIWLISGAFSGVGKTTLAGNLRQILPDSISLKIGHGKRKKDLPGNFFSSVEAGLKFIEDQKGKSQHCIVESNRLAGLLHADIMVFLDNLDGERRGDAERLRAKADIILGDKGNPEEWKSKLAGLKLPVGIRQRVLVALRLQHEFLCGSRLALRTKIWFARDGKVVFGEGLARLLYAVESLGSLSAAARTEDISYRHAWGDVKRAEERLGFRLLERSIGGKAGGGAKLTGKARSLLDGYEALRRRTVRESDRWFRKLLEEIHLE